MADSSHTLPIISASQASKEVTANALFLAGSPILLFGVDPRTTSVLDLGYLGGKYRKADGTISEIDDDVVALTDAATNYILETDGVVSKVTAAPSGWPGPLASGAKALYEIVCSGGAVTSYTDYRTNGIGSGSVASVAAADVAITDAGTYFTGTDVEAALQEIGADLAVLSGSTDVDTDVVFTSDTGSTADSDPGAGLFKWNHATQASATALYFDNDTAAAVTMTTFFAALPPDGFIHLVQDDDGTKWQLWKWSGLPTAGSGYYKFTGLTLMASGGSIADAKSTSVSFKGTAPADAARRGTTNTFTKAQSVTPVALTDAANIAVDASLSNNFSVTLGGNRTLDNPTNLTSGQILNFCIDQDGTGSRTLAFGNLYKFPGGTNTISTAASAKDFISCYYDGTILRCNLVKAFS